VLPSMSVNRKVTVPEGSAADADFDTPLDCDIGAIFGAPPREPSRLLPALDEGNNTRA